VPWVPAARADFDQGPDDIPDHVAQESVAGDADHEWQIESAAIVQIERVNRPDGAGLEGAGPLEAGEIMSADQRTRR